MAEASSSNQAQLIHESDSQLMAQSIDSKTAIKAIAKSAKFLRGILTDQDERMEMLVQHGLLEHKYTDDVIKSLQSTVGRRPSLLFVLIREISRIPGGEEAVKRLRGE